MKLKFTVLAKQIGTYTKDEFLIQKYDRQTTLLETCKFFLDSGTLVPFEGTDTRAFR